MLGQRLASLDSLLPALANTRLNRNRARQGIQREHVYWKTILVTVTVL